MGKTNGIAMVWMIPERKTGRLQGLAEWKREDTVFGDECRSSAGPRIT